MYTDEDFTEDADKFIKKHGRNVKYIWLGKKVLINKEVAK